MRINVFVPRAEAAALLAGPHATGGYFSYDTDDGLFYTSCTHTTHVDCHRNPGGTVYLVRAGHPWTQWRVRDNNLVPGTHLDFRAIRGTLDWPVFNAFVPEHLMAAVKAKSQYLLYDGAARHVVQWRETPPPERTQVFICDPETDPFYWRRKERRVADNTGFVAVMVVAVAIWLTALIGFLASREPWDPASGTLGVCLALTVTLLVVLFIATACRQVLPDSHDPVGDAIAYNAYNLICNRETQAQYDLRIHREQMQQFLLAQEQRMAQRQAAIAQWQLNQQRQQHHRPHGYRPYG